MKTVEVDKTDAKALEEKYQRESKNINFLLMTNVTLVAVGLGASGTMLKILARMFVRRWHLFDKDVVEQKNLISQSYTEKDISKKKSNAMKKILQKAALEKQNKKIPSLKIKTYGDFLDASENEIEKIIEGEREQGRDVVFIMATDYHPADARANRIAIKYKVPVFWVSLYRMGMAGEIIFYIPGYGLACYREIVLIRFIYFDTTWLENHLKGDFSGSGKSMGLPASATYVDAILLHLVVGYIHRDVEDNQHGKLFRRLLKEKRNFIQCQLDPDYRLKGEDLFAQVSGPDVITFNTIFQSESKKEDCIDCTEFKTGLVWKHTDYTKENYREILRNFNRMKISDGCHLNYKHPLIDKYNGHFDIWEKIQGFKVG